MALEMRLRYDRSGGDLAPEGPTLKRSQEMTDTEERDGLVVLRASRKFHVIRITPLTPEPAKRECLQHIFRFVEPP
jgi:hypothetical protein